jgi:hypothetical protein
MPSPSDGTTWLVATNIALGALCFVCVLIVTWAATRDALERRARRREDDRKAPDREGDWVLTDDGWFRVHQGSPQKTVS